MCVCVDVCVWPVSTPVKVPRVQNNWGSWNKQPKPGPSAGLQAAKNERCFAHPRCLLPLPHPHRASLGTRYPCTPSVLPAHHALPHKHSDNSLSMSLSCCSYGSEVFRSCRKQSYGRKLAPAPSPSLSLLPCPTRPLLTLPQLHPDVFQLVWGRGQAGPAVGQVP